MLAARSRVLTAAVLACAVLPGMAASPHAAVASPDHAQFQPQVRVLARAALVVDGNSGRTFVARNAATPRQIASITKVMTAMVVLDRGHLARKITIKQAYISYALRHGATTAGLHAGERLTAVQLLYGLMLPSGADAAYALADAYGPGPAAFVRALNRTAAELHLRHTYFADFDGLDYPAARPGHSTASDVVSMGRWALRNREFRTLAATARYRVPAGSGHRAHSWHNTNLLLGSYPGATGVKTGFTIRAGYCLLFAARRGNTFLVGVVLDSSATDPNSRFEDAAALLNLAFRAHVAVSGTQLSRMPGAQARS
jgi:serine-type D-Ala-D-Ala carboxypeptidase (penicillin-binding protein 5/6)